MREERRETAMASTSFQTPKKPQSAISDKVREEGELSSSDDDHALLSGSTTQPTSLSSYPCSSVPNAIVRTSQNVNPGKSCSTNILPGSHTQSVPSGYHKGFSKNPVLLKSNNPGWNAAGADDNLVISFSDDDDDDNDYSSSGGVKGRHGKALGDNRPPPVHRKPPTLQSVKPPCVRRRANSDRNSAPRKVSLSRTFSSSVTKKHGTCVRSGSPSFSVQTSSVRIGGPSFSVQRSCLKSSYAADRISGNQDPGLKNLDPSCSKLQDLRQQIALRENELKSKSLQQNKENVTESCAKVNLIGQGKVSSRKCKTIPADVQTELQSKEPDRKRLKVDAPAVAVSCSLSDWLSRPGEIMGRPKQTASATQGAYAAFSDRTMSKCPGASNCQASRSASEQDMHENNVNTFNGQCNDDSADKKLKSTFNSVVEGRSLQVSDSMCESPNGSPQHAGCVGRSMRLRGGDMDLQSLFDKEELLDKELDEAQELRRRFEVEERIALKAYRKAQRALAEANARCTYLYRRRELYSAGVRSLLMEDSGLYSSRFQSQLEDKLNLPNNVSEVNLELIPSNFQLQDDFGGGYQLGYDSNSQGADGDTNNRFSENEVGHNLGSEACSEPDASTSDLLGNRNNSDANDFISPPRDQHLSPEDVFESLRLDHRSHDADVACLGKGDNSREIVNDMDVASATTFSMDGCQDPVLLEKYLRSKLVSRLGVNSSSCSGSGNDGDAAAEKVGEKDIIGAKVQMIVDIVPPCTTVLPADCGDYSKKQEGIKSMTRLSALNQKHIETNPLNTSVLPAFDPEDRFHSDHSTSAVLPSSIFFSAMKAAGSVSSHCQQIRVQHYDSPPMSNDEDLHIRHSQEMLISEKEKFIEQLVENGAFDRIDSYICRSAINPLWPLCMYELRGRCNNDECPWQHEKDYSSRDVNQHDSPDTDCQTGWSLDSQSWRGKGKPSSVLTPPKYLVFLDCLKNKTHGSGSHQAHHFGFSQNFCFSHSLVVSSRPLKPSDEPCLHGNEGCVESFGSCGKTLYFQLLRNDLGDNDQSLEMALSILSQEASSLEGMKKALPVLARALEADPASLQLWIIYLLLYYSTKNEVGELGGKNPVWEDDLFSYAVKNNEQSYELWLLFINSRKQLDERFAAYERALARLCHHASAADEHLVHKSAGILDLSLQMLHCFCISGHLVEAVRRIYGLILADGDFDESHSLLLSDIIQCLTITDKCVFWVSCVYLVIYKKLPDSLVQEFEFDKDISSIEWPYVQLTLEEKQQVFKLMKVGMDSIGLHIDNEFVESSVLKSAHVLVLNHIKLLVATADEDNCRIFLEKYRKCYSSCIDVVLSARTHGLLSKDGGFEGFEEALRNWTKDTPGIQCIWNQFAAYALEKCWPGRAKEIMERWFHSACKPPFDNQSANAKGSKSQAIPGNLLLGLNMNALKSNSQVDLVFGLLNLSLYEVFQNNVLGAQSAIDKALRVADAEVLRHCVKEHAAFLFNNGTHLGIDTSVWGLLDILKGYSMHARAVPASGPLTRKFIHDIRKPRSRQLVSNLLRPLSPDSSVVNFILEIWFGSALIPQKSDEIKEVVDFVEGILEVSPANYQLVIAVSKYLCRDSTKFTSVLFWASSLLVNTVYQCIPVPPEYVWVEAANLLYKLTDVQEIHERFHQRALSANPFSIKLWRSYLNLPMDPSKRSLVVDEARRKGLEL